MEFVFVVVIVFGKSIDNDKDDEFDELRRPYMRMIRVDFRNSVDLYFYAGD